MLDEVGWSLVVIFVCAALSLFFSVNSFALRMFSWGRLEEAFEEINRPDHAEKVAGRAERLLLSCRFYLILSNVILLLALVYFFSLKAGRNPGITEFAWAFVCAIVTFPLLFLAVPHAWAKYGGEKLLCRTYRILQFCAAPLGPVLAVFGIYDGIIRRLAGVTDLTEEETHEEKQEEFLSAVEQSMREGVVDEEEQEMIENVLSLSETTAAEIITPRTDVVAVEASSDLPTALNSIMSGGHSRIPVYEKTIDNVIGVLYAKDLLAQIGADNSKFKLRDMMRQPYFVPETKPLRELLHEFQTEKQHIAVVLDEYGGMAGIVTIEDILEELVGEIVDEYEKVPPAAIKRINDDTIEIDAKVYIDDLNNDFDIDLPEEEDYDTVGGFVFSHLGYIPKTGEMFEYENLRFIISAAETRKIKRLRIQKLQPQKQSQ